MYKVAIFEDEIVIRKALINQIDWKSLDCMIVAETGNGNDGIRIIDSLRPDLLISDIRLNGCEAIEICQHIKNKGYETKTILMTGYAKMDYAQAAIKSGVSDFILKPIDPDELIDAVKKCIDELKQMAMAENEILELKKIGKNELPRLRELFLYEIYNKALVDENHIKKRCDFLNMELTDYLCIAMDIDIDNNLPDEMIHRIDELLLKIKNSVAEISREEDTYTCMRAGRVYMIVNALPIPIETYIGDIQSLIFQEYNLSISAGVSYLYKDITKIHQSMKEADDALSLKFHQGNGSVIRSENIQALPKNALGSNTHLMNHYMLIANNVMAGKPIAAKKCFIDLWDELSAVNNPTVLRNKAIEMLVILAYHLKDKKFDIEQLIPLQLMYEKIKKLSDLHSIYMLLSNLIFLVAKKRQEEIQDKNSSVIECIKTYINEHYNQSISLNDLADEVYLSEKYLSTLVKKETGQTITDLITLKRIAVAKELLRDHKLKTYEVASQVGINDARYFSQLFKKHVGLTPSQYRQS